MNQKLTENQKKALNNLLNRDGVFITAVPEKNEKDEFGDTMPGLSVYKALDKMGLVIITEEEPIHFDDGEEFNFTPTIYLTEEGRSVANSIQ